MAVPYLDIQKLTKSFGAHVLFKDISFSIAGGQKVGLIAQNGTGKSTLLSILTGSEGYDSGSIIYRRDLRVGFLEQSPSFDPNETVLDACFKQRARRSDARVLLTVTNLLLLQMFNIAADDRGSNILDEQPRLVQMRDEIESFSYYALGGVR